MSSQRTPPHDLDAEQAVLASILIDAEVVVSIGEILKAIYFYDPAHQAIYTAIMELNERREPIDVVTLTSQLKKMKKLAAAVGADDEILEVQDLEGG